MDGGGKVERDEEVEEKEGKEEREKEEEKKKKKNFSLLSAKTSKNNAPLPTETTQVSSPWACLAWYHTFGSVLSVKPRPSCAPPQALPGKRRTQTLKRRRNRSDFAKNKGGWEKGTNFCEQRKVPVRLPASPCPLPRPIPGS